MFPWCLYLPDNDYDGSKLFLILFNIEYYKIHELGTDPPTCSLHKHLTLAGFELYEPAPPGFSPEYEPQGKKGRQNKIYQVF